MMGTETTGSDPTTGMGPTVGVDPVAGGGSPYAELLAELDRSVQTIKEAAFVLKRAAGGMQAVECNADRILASTRMLEINVSDLIGRPRTLACWTDDDGVL
jgi:hypothetical protein